MHMQNDWQMPESYTLKRAATAPAQWSDQQQVPICCQVHLLQLQANRSAAWLHVAVAAAAAAITKVFAVAACWRPVPHSEQASGTYSSSIDTMQH